MQKNVRFHCYLCEPCPTLKTLHNHNIVIQNHDRSSHVLTHGVKSQNVRARETSWLFWRLEQPREVVLVADLMIG